MIYFEMVLDWAYILIFKTYVAKGPCKMFLWSCTKCIVLLYSIENLVLAINKRISWRTIEGKQFISFKYLVIRFCAIYITDGRCTHTNTRQKSMDFLKCNSKENGSQTSHNASKSMMANISTVVRYKFNHLATNSTTFVAFPRPLCCM